MFFVVLYEVLGLLYELVALTFFTSHQRCIGAALLDIAKVETLYAKPATPVIL